MYEVRLVWHVSTENDPAHQWMRALVRELFVPAITGGDGQA